MKITYYDFLIIAALRSLYQSPYNEHYLKEILNSINICRCDLENSDKPIKIYNLDEEIHQTNKIYINFKVVEDYYNKVEKLAEEILSIDTDAKPSYEDYCNLYRHALEYALPRQTYISSCMLDWTSDLGDYLNKETLDYCVNYIKTNWDRVGDKKVYSKIIDKINDNLKLYKGIKLIDLMKILNIEKIKDLEKKFYYYTINGNKEELVMEHDMSFFEEEGHILYGLIWTNFCEYYEVISFKVNYEYTEKSKDIHGISYHFYCKE